MRPMYLGEILLLTEFIMPKSRSLHTQPAAQAAPAVPAIGQTLSGEPTYREDLLQLAQKCGAVLTGKPDASEAITVVFSVDAWRAFDLATATRTGNRPYPCSTPPLTRSGDKP